MRGVWGLNWVLKVGHLQLNMDNDIYSVHLGEITLSKFSFCFLCSLSPHPYSPSLETGGSWEVGPALDIWWSCLKDPSKAN